MGNPNMKQRKIVETKEVITPTDVDNKMAIYENQILEALRLRRKALDPKVYQTKSKTENRR